MAVRENSAVEWERSKGVDVTFAPHTTTILEMTLRNARGSLLDPSRSRDQRRRGVEHQASAAEDSEVLDIVTPMREEYAN